MAVLSAALAFAITMLILSMVASVFVETLHRFIGLRETGLRIMMGHVYDRVIAPYIDKQGGNAAGLRGHFTDLMTVNRAPAGQAKGSPNAVAVNFASDEKSLDRGLLSWIWGGRRLARLGSGEFMSRLAGSEFGDHVSEAIRSAGLADPDQALKDIAARFDQMGRESSVFFERRARLVSILAAMVVAWLMYVHPYQLISTFMSNPEVTEEVIKLQDKTLEQFSAEQEAEIKRKQDAVNKANDEALKAESDAAQKQDDDTLKANAEKEREEAEVALKQLQEAIATGEKAILSLQEIGVPVGWTKQRLDEAGYFTAYGLPWPDFGNSAWFKTTLWLLLGGLLVGLGGPFWHDAVKSLSSIRGVLGGAKSLANTGESAEWKGGGDGSSRQPETPVENYHAGRAGREAEIVIEAEDEAAVG